MRVKIGGTLYRDMGDKVKVIKIVRVFDDDGNLIKFTAIGVDIRKASRRQPPHEAARGRDEEIEEKIKNILRKRGYGVIG